MCLVIYELNVEFQMESEFTELTLKGGDKSQSYSVHLFPLSGYHSIWLSEEKGLGHPERGKEGELGRW